MDNKKRFYPNTKLLMRIILASDDIIHFVVALTLMLSATFIIITTLPNFLHLNKSAILHIVNDVLLALIVMELMWPIVRFLKRENFSLNPFLYVGIISSTRRILMIEAEHSAHSSFMSAETVNWQNTWPILAEQGVNVLIILILAIVVRLVNGTKKG
jgi:uncharacterized membrane protein (DUF373 family)